MGRCDEHQIPALPNRHSSFIDRVSDIRSAEPNPLAEALCTSQPPCALMPEVLTRASV